MPHRLTFMEIDVLGWLSGRRNPQLVTADDALPGRDTPVLGTMPRHAVLDLRLDEVPEGCEVAYFAMGCYWGEERLFWSTDGVVNTAVGFMGGFTPNPHIARPAPDAPDTRKQFGWSSIRHASATKTC